MKKTLMLLFSFLLSASLAKAQTNYHDSTKYYSFSVNYWLNAHHFLWLESFMMTELDSTIIEQKLESGDRKKLHTALDYYKEHMVDKDLRTDDYMTEFKSWISSEEKELASTPKQFQKHLEVLQEFSEVYEAIFWPAHRKACLDVLNENIELIRNTEEKYVDQITTLTRQFWQFEKINVDITYVGKVTKWNLRNRPYTTIFPTHVVMNAVGENEVKGNWIELLYHESAHHLILSRSYFIGGTIKDLTEVMKVKAPRQLGHSYLFYFTGQLTQQLLNSEGISYDETYMQRNNVFSNYYPYLDIHLRAYMNREITLVEATKRMISDLNN